MQEVEAIRYADPTDEAAAMAEKSLEEALRIAKARVEKPLPVTGSCYYCHEDLEAGLRFCDADCRSDYDYMTLRRKANGR